MDRVWLQAISGRRAHRYRPGRVRLAQGNVRGSLRRLWQSARLHQHGRDPDLRTARRPEPRICRMAAEQIGARARRSGRADDAEPPAISDRAVRGAAGRHGGRQHQPPVHRARARAPAQGFRREGDRHRREFRACPAAGVAAHGSQERAGHRGRRLLGLAARHDREFRAAPRAQANTGLEHAGRHRRFKSALSSGLGLKLEPVALGPEDIAFLQYTGGTTGVAKAAMLTHRNMVANVLQASAWIKPALEPRPHAHRHHRAAALSHLLADRELPACSCAWARTTS